jgi:hypothetical protein
MSRNQQEALASHLGQNRFKHLEERSSFPAASADFDDMSSAEFSRMMQRQCTREAMQDLEAAEPQGFGRSRIRHQ